MATLKSFVDEQTYEGHDLNNNWVFVNFDNNSLFPNATAKPIKADFYVSVKRLAAFGTKTCKVKILYNSVQELYKEGSAKDTTYTNSISNVSTSEIINNSKGNSTIQLGTTCGGIPQTYSSGKVTLYFYQYDFSALSGTGISSASISSATGYDGDTTIFSCTVVSGYTFDGWYNGNTKVSSNQIYTHTVNGEDVTLIAKAVLATRTLSATYNGNTIINEQKTGDVAYSYGGISGTISANQTKTMQCNGKVCSSDIVIGGKTLQCNGELMASDVVINYS